MKIYIGADHRGFELKEKLKPWLVSLGHEVVDKGNMVLDPMDDFPDWAEVVSKAVVSSLPAGKAGQSSVDKACGILLCGSGGGMALVANKIKGVYAVVAHEEGDLLVNGGNGVNLVALPGDKINLEQAKKIIESWFKLVPIIKDQYQRRLKKIKKIEEKNFK